MRVGPPRISADQVVSAGVCTSDGSEYEISYTLPVEPPEYPEDAFLPATLMPAMARREPLVLDEPVSPRLVGAVSTIQDILNAWVRHTEVERGERPAWERVQVDARSRPAGSVAAGGRGAACFFTGGVDSFYTALKRRDELSALVYVHGFDVALEATELRARVADGVRAAAEGLGLPLLEVETDVRTASDGWLFWEDFHGAALASVALLLARRFSSVFVPATNSYAHLGPLGSHPLLDPLWSTEEVEIVHDGCEATRREKIVALAGCEPAHRWLRVCWENRDGAYNCGRCEKCLRTGMELRLVGLADEFTSLPQVDLAGLEQVPIRFGGAELRAALRSVELRGDDPDLTDVLRTALRRHRLRAPAPPAERGPVGDGGARGDELELLAAAAATAAERDRLARQVRELETRLAERNDQPGWRRRARRIRALRSGRPHSA